MLFECIVKRLQFCGLVVNTLSLRERDEQLKPQQKCNYDKHHGVREPPTLTPGERVWVPDRNAEASVQGEVAQRSYEVTTPDGTFHRNRRDLIQLQETAVQTPASQTTTPTVTDDGPGGKQPVHRSLRTTHQPERLDPSWT